MMYLIAVVCFNLVVLSKATSEEVALGGNITLSCPTNHPDDLLATVYYKKLPDKDQRIAMKRGNQIYNTKAFCSDRCFFRENDELVILRASLQDGGVYVCARDQMQKLSTRTEILVVVTEPPQQPEVQGSTVPVMEGESFTLTCIVPSTSSKLIYSWTRDGHLLRSQKRETLQIIGARQTDIGEYACAVANSAGSTHSKGVRINVRARLTRPVLDLTRSRPYPGGLHVYWTSNYKGGFNETFTIKLSTDTERKELLGQFAESSPHSYHKNLTGLEFNACYNVSIISEVKQQRNESNKMEMCTYPKITINLSADNNLVTEKQPVRLRCQYTVYSSKPRPEGNDIVKVGWVKDGRQLIMTSRMVTKVDGALIINSTESNDDGIYQCVATTGRGQREESNALHLDINALQYSVRIDVRKSMEHENSVTLEWVSDYTGTFDPTYTIRYTISGTLVDTKTQSHPRGGLNAPQRLIVRNLQPACCYNFTVTALVGKRNETSDPVKLCTYGGRSTTTTTTPQAPTTKTESVTTKEQSTKENPATSSHVEPTHQVTSDEYSLKPSASFSFFPHAKGDAREAPEVGAVDTGAADTGASTSNHMASALGSFLKVVVSVVVCVVVVAIGAVVLTKKCILRRGRGESHLNLHSYVSPIASNSSYELPAQPGGHSDLYATIDDFAHLRGNAARNETSSNQASGGKGETSSGFPTVAHAPDMGGHVYDSPVVARRAMNDYVHAPSTTYTQAPSTGQYEDMTMQRRNMDYANVTKTMAQSCAKMREDDYMEAVNVQNHWREAGNFNITHHENGVY